MKTEKQIRKRLKIVSEARHQREEYLCGGMLEEGTRKRYLDNLKALRGKESILIWVLNDSTLE